MPDSPIEEKIDLELDELVAKMVAGTAEPPERARYKELVAQRTDRMQPMKIVADRWKKVRYAY